MKKFTKPSSNKVNRFITLLVFLTIGFFIFQAQDTSINGDDPRFDQPPKSYLQNNIPQQNPELDVITDALGYDNFDIGINTAEQWITQDPNRPFNLFFGVNISGWYRTEDGHTWTPTSLGGGGSGDPIAVYDSLGNGYAQRLGGGNPVFRTTNNGLNWGPGVPSAPGGDRNTLAADQTNGPYANYLYASAWSPNANFARSTNFGATWTTTASNFPNTTPGNMIAVGPNGSIQGGAVYWVCVTGSNPPGAPTTFNIYKSLDGGLTFNLVNSTIQPGWVGVVAGSRLTINNCRTRPYPFIACDNSYGPFRGRLYCVYASNVPEGNGNKPDIKCQYSTDQGATFSAPVTVNDNVNPELSDQWFPAIWCDRYTGKLYVKWYDTRNNPATYGTDVYASYSTTGGASFVTNQKLTNANWVYPCPAVSPASYCGDYDGMVGNRFSAYAIWTDMRNCNYTNMGSYFPDFAMKVNPSVLNVSTTNDSVFSFVSIPSVKLYTDKARFTATVTPAPVAGTITLTMIDRLTQNPKDTLTTFPDSLRLRIRTSGGVTPGVYTVTVTGTGRIGVENGPPIHRRTITLNVGVVGISSNIEEPDKFQLYQNHPNPFNPSTRIEFALQFKSNVKITVFDELGRAVEVMNQGVKNAGRHFVYFNGSRLSSGVYYYKLETEHFSDTKKMLLLK